MYIPWGKIAYTTLTSNIYTTIPLNMTCDTVLFCLSESSKITLLRSFIQDVIKFKVPKKSKKKAIFRDFDQKYLSG